MREQPPHAIPGRSAGHSCGAPQVVETTALGAAYLAGLATGVYANTQAIASLWQADQTFYPTLSADRAQERMAQWEHAVRQACAR